MSVIVVSGPPGAGKSTLAHLLGRAVGCPVISRDEIFDGSMERTYEVFTEAVTTRALAGETVIAEAAFQDRRWQPILAPLLPHRVDVRVIRCRVSAATAQARFDGRAAHAARTGHPVAADAWIPIALDVPTLEVDTTDGYRPPESAILTFIGWPIR